MPDKMTHLHARLNRVLAEIGRMAELRVPVTMSLRNSNYLIKCIQLHDARWLHAPFRADIFLLNKSHR